MRHILLPFRLRFWVVRNTWIDSIEHEGLYKVVKARTQCGACGFGNYELVDGPFDTQEDAARALAFWQLQDGTQAPRRAK